MSSESIFDRADLMDRVGEDEDLARELIELFREDAPKQIEGLKQALETNDIPTATRHAHTLKGAASNISAPGVQNIASQMETACTAENLEAVATQLPELQEQLDRFMAIAQAWAAS